MGNHLSEMMAYLMNNEGGCTECCVGEGEPQGGDIEADLKDEQADVTKSEGSLPLRGALYQGS